MLKFIGTGSAFNTKLGNNSAYIKEGNKLFLIDCGSANFHRMKESGLLDDVEFIYVYVTHTHADHVGSLADLIFYMYYMKGEHKARVEVIYRKESQLDDYLDFNGVEEQHYLSSPVEIGQEIEVEVNIVDIDVTFIPFDTSHVDNLYSAGIVGSINGDGNCFIYTGDINKLSKGIVNALENDSVKAFYVDTCSQDYEGNVHLSLKKLCEHIKPEYRHKVWCMHLDEGFDVQYAKSLGFNVAEVEM